jgi:hypothetical protein
MAITNFTPEDLGFRTQVFARDNSEFNKLLVAIFDQLLGYVGCVEGFLPQTPSPPIVVRLEQILRHFPLPAGLGPADVASIANVIAMGGTNGMAMAVQIAALIAALIAGERSGQAEISSMFLQLRLGSASLPAILNAINSSNAVTIRHGDILTALAMPAAGATMYLASLFRSRSR